MTEGISQGVVRGRVTDENGEVMIGVSVFLKGNPSLGTTTDLDGYYELELKEPINDTLVISYVSYQNIEEPLHLKDAEVLIRDFVLNATTVTLDEVEITAKQERGSQYYMESIKKKSSSTLDYISSDLMKRVGDSNVSSAISRVTGVSTNGNFITVRGLGDRYVKTGINGSVIPTLDPFTNNIRLDLFPASLIDNIVVMKTASPDLQGDWSAAYISVETKDYPERLSVSIETKIGYNPQTSFKNILATETSSTDWLGFDNGYRDIDHDRYIEVNHTPTSYEEFAALGLADYYRSLGVTESWHVGSQAGETYFRLGLVELGLLGKAFIDDEQAVNEAKARYTNGSYRSDAFRIINADAEKALDEFRNNWSTLRKTAPVDFSQTFAIGNQTLFLGKQFGYIAGFRYSKSIQFDPNAIINRTGTTLVDDEGNPAGFVSYDQEIAKYSAGWTALASTNLKTNENNAFSILFMANLIGANNVKEGVDDETLVSGGYNFAFQQNQYYEERSQIVYQYKSEHYLPSSRIKLNLNASYAGGQSSVPDFKDLLYFSRDESITDTIEYLIDATESKARRNYRYLDEDILDAKVFAELPMSKKAGNVSKIKVGAEYIQSDRDFNQYDYLLRDNSGAPSVASPRGGSLNDWFPDEKFNFSVDPITGATVIPLFYGRTGGSGVSLAPNHTIGQSKVYSGFVMADQSVTRRIRVNGGIRAEYTDLFSDVKLYRDLGYGEDDLRRRSSTVPFTLSPSKIQQLNILPIVNLIYRIKADDLHPSNLRLNYSRTIARPSLREYTENVVYDYELGDYVYGNSELKFVEIDNYDLRYEDYFASGDIISFSLFYKTFNNHIELANLADGFTWWNANKSYVYGVELEGRKKINDHFEFRANVTAVKSYTELEDRSIFIANGEKSWVVHGIIERRMFGQAPYVINAILNYDHARMGFSASLSYNIQGPKLVLASADLAPDIYEMPRQLFNLKVSQDLDDHFSMSLTISDLLNSARRRAYKYDEGYLLDFDKIRYGTDYSVGISYKL